MVAEEALNSSVSVFRGRRRRRRGVSGGGITSQVFEKGLGGCKEAREGSSWATTQDTCRSLSPQEVDSRSMNLAGYA